MLLINKKKIIYKDVEYLVDVFKDYDITCSGKDYYTYSIRVYDIKPNTGIKRLLNKYKQVHYHKTYWMKYFDFKGDISEVIKTAFKSFDYNTREQKSIKEVENSKFEIKGENE